MTIKSELVSLMHDRELTDPREIESWARVNTESSLHKNLKYDDVEGAAHEWRINEIRKFICVHVVDNNDCRTTISLSVDRGNGGYRHLEPVLDTPNLRDIAIHDELKKLIKMRDQHEEYGFNEFSPIWDAIDSVRRNLKAKASRKDTPASGVLELVDD